MKYVKKVSQISNGINVDDYKSVDTIDVNFPTRFVSIGRLIERKNPIAIVEAFAQSKLYDKGVQLDFIGDGHLSQNISSTAKELGINDFVHCKGVSNNIPSELRNYHVLISASYAEGLPLTIIEAAVAGRVIIASDISPHYEIKCNYPSLITFNHSSTSDLANAVNNVYNNFRQNIPSDIIREQVINFYDYRIMSMRYLDHFQRLASSAS